MKTKRHIFSENPYQKMWDTFVFFESEPTTKNFLLDIYQKNGQSDGFKFAFLNTSKFIYFIKQAKEYFFSAEKSSILVKPLLIYYGMMSLIKAVILTKDPNYPNQTSVLRHGITTRKLKKANYQFHEDEIRIQKEGLLPWFYTLVTGNTVEKIEGTKYKIKDLLSLLPELHESYKRLFKEQYIFPIFIINNTSSNITFKIPKEILTFYHNSPVKLSEQLNRHIKKSEGNLFNYQYNNLDDEIIFTWNNENNANGLLEFLNHPMVVRDYKDKYYLHPFSETKLLLPEMMIDYLLMYNLGMLCRYDTELWGEIIFSFASEDMFIINELVNITLRRFPNLILNELFNEILIFETV